MKRIHDLWHYLIGKDYHDQGSVPQAEKIFKYPAAYTWKNGPRERKSQQAVEESLVELKKAHPQCAAEIDQGFATHYLLTGGKLLFNDEPIPTDVGPKLHPVWLKRFTPFRTHAQRLVGRPATWDDMFWLIYQQYLPLVFAKGGPTDVKLNLCLTEAVSKPYFKFFIDMDLVFSEKHDDQVWRAFVKDVCEGVAIALANCYPDIDAKGDPDKTLWFSVLDTVGYRPRTLASGQEVFKRGIHLVWPRLVVDKHSAECIARVVEERLTSSMARDLTKGDNSWENAIDLSVYKTGLRLVGCPKAKPCKTCKSFSDASCAGKRNRDVLSQAHSQMCHPDPPFGFEMEGIESMYKLSYIARSDGRTLSRTNFIKEHEAHVIRDQEHVFDFSTRELTSIRTSAKEMTPGLQLPEHLRESLPENHHSWNVTVKYDPVSGNALKGVKRATLHGTQRGHELYLAPSLLNHLTRILRKFDEKYSNILVDRMWAFPVEVKESEHTPLLPSGNKDQPRLKTLYTQVWVKVRGEGSTYCFNKGGCHNSSTARFGIDFKGNIWQSCWSEHVYNGMPCRKKNTKTSIKKRFTPVDYEHLVSIFTTRTDGTISDATVVAATSAAEKPGVESTIVKCEEPPAKKVCMTL